MRAFNADGLNDNGALHSGQRAVAKSWSGDSGHGISIEVSEAVNAAVRES